MKNSRIAYIVKKAETKNEIDGYQIHIRRTYIDKVIKNIRNIAKQFPGISKQELRDKILIKISEELRQYCDIANIKGRYFQLEATRKVLFDKSIIEREYDLIKDDPRYQVTEERRRN